MSNVADKLRVDAHTHTQSHTRQTWRRQRQCPKAKINIVQKNVVFQEKHFFFSLVGNKFSCFFTRHDNRIGLIAQGLWRIKDVLLGNSYLHPSNTRSFTAPLWWRPPPLRPQGTSACEGAPSCGHSTPVPLIGKENGYHALQANRTSLMISQHWFR